MEDTEKEKKQKEREEFLRWINKRSREQRKAEKEKQKGDKKKIGPTIKKPRPSKRYLFDVIPELSRQEKLLLLARRNLKRFADFGLTLDNLGILVVNLDGDSRAKAEPFLEKCLITRQMLSCPKKIQDFIVLHEIIHIFLNQELAGRFYGKHPDFIKKREDLIGKIINKQPDGLALPDNMEDFLDDRIFSETNKLSGVVTGRKALLILENVLKAAKEEREVCTNAKKFKSARKSQEAENSFFLGCLKKPLSHEEYDRLVIIGFFLAGRSLTIYVGKNKLIQDSGYKMKFTSHLELSEMEEAVANYLAGFLANISPLKKLGYKDKHSQRMISYLLKMRDQYRNNPKEVIERIKKGQSAYKILFRK